MLTTSVVKLKNLMAGTLKIGFYQFNPIFGKKEENLQKVISALENTGDALIVLPELFATGYQFVSGQEVEALSERVPEGPTTKALIEVAKKRSLYIVGGLAEKADTGVYNSAVLVGPEGFIGLYRKTHLFFEEKLYFRPGDTGFRVFEIESVRVGIMICFDWFFPEGMRTLALKGAHVVCHPANLVLPYCPNAMPVRCLENRLFAVTANRTGKEERAPGKALRYIGLSEVVSPAGEVLFRAGQDQEVLFTTEVNLKEAEDKSLNPYNDLFKDRRPEFYYLY